MLTSLENQITLNEVKAPAERATSGANSKAASSTLVSAALKGFVLVRHTNHTPVNAH